MFEIGNMQLFKKKFNGFYGSLKQMYIFYVFYGSLDLDILP